MILENHWTDYKVSSNRSWGTALSSGLEEQKNKWPARKEAKQFCSATRPQAELPNCCCCFNSNREKNSFLSGLGRDNEGLTPQECNLGHKHWKIAPEAVPLNWLHTKCQAQKSYLGPKCHTYRALKLGLIVSIIALDAVYPQLSDYCSKWCF